MIHGTSSSLPLEITTHHYTHSNMNDLDGCAKPGQPRGYRGIVTKRREKCVSNCYSLMWNVNVQQSPHPIRARGDSAKDQIASNMQTKYYQEHIKCPYYHYYPQIYILIHGMTWSTQRFLSDINGTAVTMLCINSSLFLLATLKKYDLLGWKVVE